MFGLYVLVWDGFGSALGDVVPNGICFPALRVLFLPISVDFHASIAFACFSIHHITTLNI